MTETSTQDAPAAQNSESSTNTTEQTTTTQTANDNPLLSSVSADYADLVKTKGWKSPDDVIASYSNMEKFAGKFSSRGIVIPDSDSPEEWGKVYDKLGRPEAPNGYEFNHIDVNTLDEDSKQHLNFVKELGFEVGLTKSQMEKFVSKYDAKMAEIEVSHSENAQRSIDKQVGELKNEWGEAWDQKIALARSAAKKFGIEGEKLAALETNAGFAPMMKALAEIGESLFEDGFVAGFSGSSNPVRTPKQAMQELKEVQADPDYLDAKKNPNRHKILREKARDLYQMVYPTAKE